MYRTDLNEAIADAQGAANAYGTPFVVFAVPQGEDVKYGRVIRNTWYDGNNRCPEWRRLSPGGTVLTFIRDVNPSS